MDYLPRIAVADLGTNTFNLIIAEKRPLGGFSVLWEATRESRLGRNNGLKGQLSQEALSDALALMQYYDSICRKYRVTDQLAIGTSALRQAVNSDNFKQSLEQQTHFKLLIISGEKEAQLIHEGIFASGCLEEKRLILDIGGGSCEFIIAHKQELLWKKSFEIGMVRASHFALTDNDFKSNNTSTLLAYFKPALTEVAQAIDEYQPIDLVGAAGSFDTLVALANTLQNNSFTHNYLSYSMKWEHFFKLRDKIIFDSIEQRLQYPGIIPVRASLLPYALTLIEATWELLPPKASLICTSYALREGVANMVFENRWTKSLI